MAALVSFWRMYEGLAPWRRQLLMTGICIVALAAAFVVGALSPAHVWIPVTIAYVAGMRYPLAETLGSLRRGRLDVDFLMLLVAAGAWIVGHPEEGAFLLVLFTGSRAMESYAQERTRSAIEELTTRFPTQARRLSNGVEEQVGIGEIAPGDRLVIRPGEYFPVDCRVEEGRTTVDLSAITGEEEPLIAGVQSEVPSGGVNGLGLVEAEALRPAGESSYQKILRLIEEAPARRAPAQVLSDRVGRYFTVAILLISFGGFAFWYFVSSLPLSAALYRAMALLVAGSPCALVLSIPSGVLAGIATGARRGILFHGGLGLLGAAQARTIAFDKTGTLTTGEPHVVAVDGEHANDPHLSSLALRLAQSSTHPASRAVVRYLESQGIAINGMRLDETHEQPGHGVIGIADGQTYLLGRAPDAETIAAEGPIVALSTEGRTLLRFHLQETPRAFAACAAAWLRINRFKLIVLSGDNRRAVERLGRRIGIDDARGGLRPEDKYAVIDEEAAGGPVMMVGDGVNDAPALARADIGVAMGMRGSAAALAQADIVLVKDRLMDLVHAVELSRFTRRLIHQNMTIAIAAAAVLVSFALAGKLPLALGVLGHEGGTVLVVLNSLRLLAWRSHVRAEEPEPEPAAALEAAGGK